MAEEKGVTSVQWDCTPDTSDAATFMSLWDNGFILRNAGEYLSLFEVSQFLTTCKEWKRMFKSKIEPIKFFWQAAAAEEAKGASGTVLDMEEDTGWPPRLHFFFNEVILF